MGPISLSLSRGWKIISFVLVSKSAAGFLSPDSYLRKSSRRTPTSNVRAAHVLAATAGSDRASSSGKWALIFDCDGVILESESLHREAYNTVFREFDVDYCWSPGYYDELQNKVRLIKRVVTRKRRKVPQSNMIVPSLFRAHHSQHVSPVGNFFFGRVGGGKPKMRFYFGENGWPKSKLGGPPETDEDKDRLIDSLQERKTQIYKDFVADGTAVLRPGIQRLIDEVVAIPGGKMAICSASTKEACLFVLDNLLGTENLNKFDLILAGDDVPRRKPDPMIYTLAAEKLGVDPEKCMVIEDSLIGLQAAVGAGMKCVITHTESTKNQDFAGAAKIYPELGEEGSVQVRARELLALVDE